MSLTAFYKENVKNPFEEIDYVVSDRFKGEDGKAIAWKLRPLNPDKLLKAGDSATKINGKQVDFSSSDYMKNIVVNTVIYPNLYDKELQDSYGVMEPKQLISAMLNGREFNRLLKKCQEVNGLDKDFEELKEEVKN